MIFRKKSIEVTCSLCANTCATITLSERKPYSLFIEGFLGNATFRVDRLIRNHLIKYYQSKDFHKIQEIDNEYAPFYCKECKMCYCIAHWKYWTVYDDGFYDATRGVCPNGHEKTLDD